MEFCDQCGSLLTPDQEQWRCTSCGWSKPKQGSTEHKGQAKTEGSQQATNTRTQRQQTTDLEQLETTDSGAVRKEDAMRWLNQRTRPSDAELKAVVEPKPDGFSGSTYPTAISNIRVTGDPEFIETIAGLLKPFTDFEDHRYRLEINLQQTEDRDTGDLTENYALYLSVAERGGR